MPQVLQIWSRIASTRTAQTILKRKYVKVKHQPNGKEALQSLQLYRYNTAKFDNETAHKHNCNGNYIRHGNSMSPLMFNVNVIMDKIIDSVKADGKRYRLGNRTLNILYYADVAVLITKSEEDSDII